MGIPVAIITAFGGSEQTFQHRRREHRHKEARYYWLLLAESQLTRRLFGGMLRKVAALPSPAG